MITQPISTVVPAQLAATKVLTTTVIRDLAHGAFNGAGQKIPKMARTRVNQSWWKRGRNPIRNRLRSLRNKLRFSCGDSF
jgi:hypothetical protein